MLREVETNAAGNKALGAELPTRDTTTSQAMLHVRNMFSDVRLSPQQRRSVKATPLLLLQGTVPSLKYFKYLERSAFSLPRLFPAQLFSEVVTRPPTTGDAQALPAIRIEHN